MTGRERAELRSAANGISPIFQIGKADIQENLIEAVDSALEKRELIKLSVLETATLTAQEAAQMLAEATHAEVIQCIGRKIVLYRENPMKDEAERAR
ncbi:MAG: YhbY family RNA-binding protein [Clostridia bacterium]